jgi:hypothetical protein
VAGDLKVFGKLLWRQLSERSHRFLSEQGRWKPNSGNKDDQYPGETWSERHMISPK